MLYLGGDGQWTKRETKAIVFSDAVSAISYCIQRKLRNIRLVSNSQTPGKEIFVYPFGHDPAIKAQVKALRKAVSRSRRLNRERRLLLARLDMLRAEAKERKKQFPFKRKT